MRLEFDRYKILVGGYDNKFIIKPLLKTLIKQKQNELLISTQRRIKKLFIK